ncbi:hypothetical protein [Actinokineospora diospyrosa]|uniref:hypothetical protein n=1 Tax=Actinokineospora diospyrosa TaxID=103728 RepID=UPI0020A2E135|nr:hypothetical protein [Actinokineospora diospyrosa]
MDWARPLHERPYDEWIANGDGVLVVHERTTRLVSVDFGSASTPVASRSWTLTGLRTEPACDKTSSTTSSPQTTASSSPE